jgi:hypothetical protein
MNVFGGISPPGVFPPVGGFPSMAGAQLAPFPGSSGRVRIVCCAIPE